MNKRCENIKAVIFDMDGVIINSEKLWRKSFKLTNKKLKVYVPEKFRQSCSGIPFATNLQRMKTAYPDIDAELYFNTAREIHNYLLETDKHLIKNGFFKLISAIKEKNLKIGLCTSSTLPKVQSLFKKKNIPIEYFDAIITGDQVKNGKPHPEPYLATCDLLKENPKDCLVLEDSINGIISAYNAGTVPIMVLDIIRPNKETKSKCVKIVKSLKSVLKFI